jgi:hypothetical protein
MSETPLSVQDQLELDMFDIEQHSLLKIWGLLLDNVEKSSHERIPITVAAKVIASWPFLTFQETAIYHDVYHRILGELRDLLKYEVADKLEHLDWAGDDDVEHNHEIYKDVLVAWHNQLDSYEEEWDASAEDSQVWVAAIADARAFFFSQVGLAGQLDAIGFSLSDGEFLEAVEKSREAKSE